METQIQQNISLSCDDSYISLLLTESDTDQNTDQTLMSDENYAEKLQLQEAIMSSLITLPHIIIPGQVFASDQISREFGETRPSSSSVKTSSWEIGESSSSVKNSREIIGESILISQLYTCEICAETKNIHSDFFPIQNCSHRFCKQCISRHVSIKIQKRTITSHGEESIPCPRVDCRGMLGMDTCRDIMPRDVLSTWDKIICESMILPSQKFYCPYKSCSGLLVNDESSTGSKEEVVIIKEAECPFCNRLFCAKCKVPWHSGIGCEEFSRLSENERGREDLMVHELAKKNKWQRCPSCMFFVDKKEVVCT